MTFDIYHYIVIVVILLQSSAIAIVCLCMSVFCRFPPVALVCYDETNEVGITRFSLKIRYTFRVVNLLMEFQGNCFDRALIRRYWVVGYKRRSTISILGNCESLSLGVKLFISNIGNHIWAFDTYKNR